MKWISVKDKVPEIPYPTVLAASKHKVSGRIMIETAFFDGWDWYQHDEIDSPEWEVTHWMPLPDPPKF